jgi:hypothetical protein
MWFCDSTIKLYDVDGLNKLFAKDKQVTIQKPLCYRVYMCGAIKGSGPRWGKKTKKIATAKLTTAGHLGQRQLLS